MRKLFFLFSLCLSLIAQAVDPAGWINEIQAREGKIRRELLQIQSHLYGVLTPDEKTKYRLSLANYREELNRLESDIQSMYDQQFWAGAAEEWKNVLQQADGLQSLNKEILQDLEGQLHRKR